MIHGRDQTPLVDRRLVFLGRVLSILSVKAAHGVYEAAQHRHADVAASCVHGRYFAPRLLQRVVAATRVEVVHAVKTTDDVDFAVNGCAPVISTWTYR